MFLSLQDVGPSESTFNNSKPESGLSPHSYDTVNSQNSTSIQPPSQFHDEVNNQHSTNIQPSFQYHDKFNDKHSALSPPTQQFDDEVSNHHSTNFPPTLPSYPTAGYTSHDFHPPPPATRSDSFDYSQPYHHQSYPQEPQQHLPHNYPPHETNSFPYTHFQSYPSFTESSLPAVPSQYPSYFQGPDASYSPQSAPPTTDYPSTNQIQASSKNGNVTEPTPSSSKAYKYDSNYQPTPEKIAEAHKAARFAVGALAFDDVFVAVDHLRKSLELLTNPSAGQ